MRKHPLYLGWGLLVLGTLLAVELGGWTLASGDEGRTNPQSVRDNPGAYRTVYRSPTRFRGGK